MSSPELSILDLKKAFAGTPPLKALNGVSFELKRGEILGLLGPNGAGKTTTIRILISLLKPDSGQVNYFGKSLFTHRSEVLEKVGFASTYTWLPLFLTVEENLHIHGTLYGLKYHERRARMDKLLSYFDLLSFKKRRFTQLSAGQRTMVMLVKAFLPVPRIALLDEPTASLDPDVTRRMRAFLKERQREDGVSILYTSHDMDEVTELCQRVVFLRDGGVLAIDSPTALASSVAYTKLDLTFPIEIEKAAAFLREKSLQFEAHGNRISLQIHESDMAELILAFGAAGIKFSKLSLQAPTLEDYFLQAAKS